MVCDVQENVKGYGEDSHIQMQDLAYKLQLVLECVKEWFAPYIFHNHPCLMEFS
jgi:hypothetical protein